MKVDDTILGKLFWCRSEDGENQEEYNNIRDEYRKKYDSDIIEKDLINFFNENVKDEKKKLRYRKMLKEYSNCLLQELSFESPFFYKLGFKDGYKFYKELNDLKIKNNKKDEIYQDMSAEVESLFCELFEKERQKLIEKNEQYRDLQKKKKEYNKKYPNVIIAIEDGEGTLNEEEVKIMSELFAIELEISFFENVLAYKMGRRNANELF